MNGVYIAVILAFTAVMPIKNFQNTSEKPVHRSAVSQKTVNSFRSVKQVISIGISEPNGNEYSIYNGCVSNKKIQVINDGNVPVYAEAFIAVTVKNKISGQVSLKPVVINDVYCKNAVNVNFQINTDSWEVSEGGKIRYKTALLPGEISQQLLNGKNGGSIAVKGLDKDEYISFLVFVSSWRF